MTNILVIDKERDFLEAVRHEAAHKLRFKASVATSLAETREIVEKSNEKFLLALVNLSLPDVLNGDFLDFLDGEEIPVVGLTGEVTDAIREYVSSMNVLDYLVVRPGEPLDNVISFMERFHKNKSTKVLVVDDSRSARLLTSRILKSYGFLILEASSGEEAVKAFEENPDVMLIITDYVMPGMDGVGLIHRIRSDFKKNKGEVAIIGISAFGSNILSAKFIKNGANDFLNKPFLKEEFFCRINQNIEYIENLAKIRELSEVDSLSGLFNRRVLYDRGARLFSEASRGLASLTAIAVDIDHFKRINDTYGHAIGDIVINGFGRLLKEAFRKTDVVARVGGEEFCVLAVDLKPEAVLPTLERLRKSVEELIIEHDGKRVTFTVSMGVKTALCDTFEATLNAADALLYKAKETGRNRVVTDLDRAP